MTVFRRLAALLLALSMLGTAQAQTFPKLTGRVVDAANLLSPEQEAELTTLSEQVEQASSRQFVVATIPDLQDYPIEDYGQRLGTAWKIGQGGANNGIILIVAPNERKVRIEVGYGLEPIMTDAYSGWIIRDRILPEFRDGDMPGGIMAGANAVAEQMKLPLEAAEQRVKQQLDQAQAQARPSGRGARSDGNPVIAIFWVVFFFVLIASVFGSSRRGRRYRGSGGGSGLANVILWSALDAATRSSRGGSSWGGGGGGGSWGGGGGGGFSGGGGSFGGGGASGSW